MWGLARPYWKRLTIAYVSLLVGRHRHVLGVGLRCDYKIEQLNA